MESRRENEELRIEVSKLRGQLCTQERCCSSLTAEPNIPDNPSLRSTPIKLPLSQHSDEEELSDTIDAMSFEMYS